MPFNNTDLEDNSLIRDFLRRREAKLRAEVLVEGQILGRAQALREVLQAKFGAVPGAVDDKIRTASTEALQSWLLRALDAPTLEAVFAPAVR